MCVLFGCDIIQLVNNANALILAGWLMTVAETGMSSFCAFLLRQAKPYPRRAPLKDYALLGVYYMMARVLSNLSVDYTDYPTQVVVKSSKVIPAMILGFWILKVRNNERFSSGVSVVTHWFVQKRYAFLEYATAILLVSGIIVFTLAGSSATPTFSGIGVAFGATSVIFDGVVGNTQEKLMKGTKAYITSLNGVLCARDYHPTPCSLVFFFKTLTRVYFAGQGVMETEMILFMNFFSFLYCFAGGLVTGIAADTVKFVWTFPEGPKAILGYAVADKSN
jgi:hypothetical protein